MNKHRDIDKMTAGTQVNIELNQETYVITADYNTKYDAAYLKRLRKKAMLWLNQIDPDAWLREVRGYDA